MFAVPVPCIDLFLTTRLFNTLDLLILPASLGNCRAIACCDPKKLDGFQFSSKIRTMAGIMTISRVCQSVVASWRLLESIPHFLALR
ncbi:Mucin-5AC [Fusarium oxysporum f. sp. albedinis]|nr:Mucin-5AC [Fusarium oxysporum f. sp. albedinis]